MPKVSVYMPVYNIKEEWLRASIESILNQTFTDFEFIIINDGSTNNAKDVILSYKDSRIRYIEQENQGFIAASNKGLELAQGEYIAKMDSDDISLPSRLEKQVDYLNKNPDVGLVGVGFQLFDKSNITVIHPENVGYLDFLKCTATTIFMLRKSIIKKFNIKFRDEYIHAEDYDFYVNFLRYSNIRNIQEILYMYRWSGENVSIQKADIQSLSAQKVQNNILNILCGENLQYRKMLINIIFSSNINTKNSFIENIFSIKNYYSNGTKFKIITILGIKIKIKKPKRACP